MQSPPHESYVTPPPGYRLPAAIRLGPVRLQVSDLSRSLAYYGDVLGFRVADSSASRATLAAHGDDTPLVRLEGHPGSRPVPRNGRLGLYHFAILLPAREALGRLLSHLESSGIAPGAADHFVSEALYLHDPDGLGIEIYADRPRQRWPIEAGALSMGVEPLDQADLVRAARGTPWTGMPAGTVIGHVHLHVGDLGTARRFYHEALGLDEVARIPGALFLSAGGYHHHLGMNVWARHAPPAGPDEARLLEWTMLVPTSGDLESAARALESSGYPTTSGEGRVLAMDPWGTPLRLVAPDDA